VRRRVAALVVVLTLVAAPAASSACPRTSLAAMENDVMCLVCGVPLALADAPQAQRERVFIERMVNQCRSKDEIERALVAQYGPRVLALPKASGFRVTAYLVPALAALAAAAGIALVAVRRPRLRRRAGQRPRADAPPIDPLQSARIDAELERYR
jgi:cytochrome c-type biogenesis protein CcmH